MPMDLTALMVFNVPAWVIGMLINPVPILFLNLRVNLNCFPFFKCQRFQAIIKFSYFPDTNPKQTKTKECVWGGRTSFQFWVDWSPCWSCRLLSSLKLDTGFRGCHQNINIIVCKKNTNLKSLYSSLNFENFISAVSMAA